MPASILSHTVLDIPFVSTSPRLKRKSRTTDRFSALSHNFSRLSNATGHTSFPALRSPAPMAPLPTPFKSGTRKKRIKKLKISVVASSIVTPSSRLGPVASNRPFTVQPPPFGICPSPSARSYRNREIGTKSAKSSSHRRAIITRRPSRSQLPTPFRPPLLWNTPTNPPANRSLTECPSAPVRSDSTFRMEIANPCDFNVEHPISPCYRSGLVVCFTR
jgi:hypothetical protein